MSKSIADYLEIAPAHQREGRDWSPVAHSDLAAWQRERTELMMRVAELEPGVIHPRGHVVVPHDAMEAIADALWRANEMCIVPLDGRAEPPPVQPISGGAAGEAS